MPSINYDHPLRSDKSPSITLSEIGRFHVIAGSLESAYSLNWGAREIWGQDLGTFMISRPI